MKTSHRSLLCFILFFVASSWALTAANISPSVNWIRPTNGASFSAGSTIVLRVTASDPDGAVSFVDFFANSTNQSIHIGRAAGTLTNLYTVPWSNAPAGTFQLQAEAVDDAGERGLASVIISIRPPPPPTNMVPAVTWIRPTNGTSFLPGSSILLTAHASDADGTVSFVDFFANALSLGRVLGPSTNGLYNFMWSNVPAGTHHLHAEARDNLNGRGISALAQIVVDDGSTNPVVTWLTPSDGGSIAAGTPILLRARATDRDGTVSYVDFFDDANRLARVVTATSNVYSFVWSNAPVGMHQLSAEAVDNDGSSGADVVQIEVTSTNQPPTNAAPIVDWVSPSDGFSFPGGSSPLLTAHAFDTDGTVSFVDFFANSNMLGRVFPGTNNYYSFRWSNAPSGTHRLQAEAVDDDGRRGISRIVQIVVTTNQPPTNPPPVVNWLLPSDGAIFVAPGPVELRAQALDPDAPVFMEFFANSNRLGGSFSSSVTFSFIWSNTPPGTYRVHAEAVDSGGARGITDSVQIIVTTNINSRPVVSWIQPTNGATFPPGSRLSLRARATDFDGTVSSVDFFATPTNGPPINVGRGTRASPDGLYIAGWTNPPAGQYQLHAEAVDNSGGRGVSDSVQIMVTGGTNEPPANTPPLAAWLDPADGVTFTAPGPVLMRAQATDSDGTVSFVEFFANSNRLGAASSSSNIYHFVWSNTPPGNFRLHAEAVDSAGARGISDSVQVFVSGGPTNQPSSNAPPTIVNHPQSQTVTNGATVTLSVSATGSEPLGYRWRRNTILITGANSPTLTLSNVTAANAGTYSVLVSNMFGARISSNAVLTVISSGSNSPPVVTLTSPTNGSVFRSRQPVVMRALASDPDGTISFVDFFANTTRVARVFSFGGTNFTGVWSNAPAGMYDIRAVAQDSGGAQGISETVSITVLSNRPPVAHDQSVSVEENASRVITLTGSDPDGDFLVFNVLTQPAHGSLSGSPPSVRYTPAADYSGPDSFTFSVRDGQFQSAPATVQITVTPMNNPPVALIDIPGTVLYFGIPTIIVLPGDDTDDGKKRKKKDENPPIPTAIVVLDASQSFDPDGDALQYSWLIAVGANFPEPLASGIRVTNELAPNVYEFVLLVSDGRLSTRESLRLDIMTPCEAFALLIPRIDQSFIKQSDKRVLIQALVTSCEDFESGDIASALERLQAFQHKVVVKIGQSDPEFAEFLLNESQALIDAIQVQ